MIQKYCKEEAYRYGCVVLVYGTWRPRKTRGIRVTKIHGYSPVAEFYHPDRSQVFPDETDYRRTLYWNPNVRTDSTGQATIQFYNNSTCTRLRVSAAAVNRGKIGYLEQ